MGDVSYSPLEPLWRKLRSSMEDCPFIVQDAGAKNISVEHFDGSGRDVKYVSIHHHPPDDENPANGAYVKVAYAPFVAGTVIIYDVTESTLQGKARPFYCKVTEKRPRLFAILPYQIESIQLAAAPVMGKVQFEVFFADARGEAIQAVLPFEIRYVDGKGETRLSEIRVTTSEGRHVDSDDYRWHKAPGRWTVIVRSLLTGREQSQQFDLPT
jgi:hypothetical protein